MKIFKSEGLKSQEIFMPNITGRNNVQMGTAVMKAHTESEWDYHPGDEYSFVIQGELVCYTKEGEEYMLKAGDGIFTPAGQEHRSVCVSDEDCACLWIEVAL